MNYRWTALIFISNTARLTYLTSSADSSETGTRKGRMLWHKSQQRITHICRVNWQKTGSENRFFVSNVSLAPIFAKIARFYNYLINKDFRKTTISWDCQKGFLMKNSLENFSSEYLSDLVKVPFSSHQSTVFYLTSHWNDVFMMVFYDFERCFR